MPETPASHARTPDASHASQLRNRPPVALSIAGTDPSGGAGIHADLKAFTARAVYGTTVVTALVAQNTHGVSRVYPIDTDFVADQFDSVLGDMPVDASKTGMLGSRELVELAVDRATTTRATTTRTTSSHATTSHATSPHRRDETASGAVDSLLGFLTVDPVMVATSGHRLLQRDAVSAVRDLLVPVAHLITPNLPEAALLLGDDVPEASSVAEQRAQAVELVRRGSRAVLLKGGHMNGDTLVDVLAMSTVTTSLGSHPGANPDSHPESTPDSNPLATPGRGPSATGTGEWTTDGDVLLREFHHPRIRTPHTHGTGCTLSAAITAEAARAVHHGTDLSSPDTLAEIVTTSLAYLARAIASGSQWELSHDREGAHGPVDHLVDLSHSLPAGASS